MAVIECVNPDGHRYTFNSITCELVDDELLYELQVPANCYRAEKLPLYSANEVWESGKGQLLGSLKATPTTTLKIKADETSDVVADQYNIKIVECDRILLQGTFEEDTLAQILFIAEDNTILRYKIDTTHKDFQAMCVGTFQKANNREIDTFINKTGLCGKYQIKLLLPYGESYKIYQTNITISV